MKKLVALLLAAVMCVGLLAGCGNSNSSTSAAPSQAVSAAPTGEKTEYTYNNYTSALATNWNEHTWETNGDDLIRSYLTSGFVDLSIKDSENGVYQWVYEMATSITDVTAQHQDDLVKYGSTLPEGKSASDITAQYVYEIALNPDAKWQNGESINADNYIYSMKQLLNPEMHNYRANLYYAGESAVAGGFTYYNSLETGYYVATDYETAMGMDPSEVFIDCWDFWGAEGYVDADGNECAQYVSIADTTVYGEDVGDAFSGADLFANYGAYFADGSYSLYVYTENANYNENYEATYDDTVGLYKVDDYTIRYVMQAAQDMNYFLVSCTTTWLVYEDLYEAGKDTTGKLVTTDYCTSVETSMSYGPYMLESIQTDKQMVLVQNPYWYGWEEDENGNLVSYTNFDVDGAPVQQYQTTRIVIDVMDDDAAKQAFLKGEQSTWTPSAADLLTYGNSDQAYKAPETYTYSFFFDCNLDDLKAMDASKGNQNSVVLSNINFRKAMSLSIDRAEYCTATPGWLPAYAILNSLYFYDVYNDPESSYRSSDEAMQAICNLYGVEYGEGKAYATLKDAYDSINGYNLTEAKELMKTACDELVADGLYTAGDPITIRIAWAAGQLDTAANNQLALLNKFVNAAVEGSGFGAVTFEAVGNLSSPSRYDLVRDKEYAIGYGAWGGAAFYPFRNFQVYCDPDQYPGMINEINCWDPTTTMLTIDINGEPMTMSWQAWSQSLVGTGPLANESFDVKLHVTATMEEEFLKFYYRIPLASMTTTELLSYKHSYYTEDYNIMYGFGGLRLMSYNYSDKEWTEFVSSQGGTLSYE